MGAPAREQTGPVGLGAGHRILSPLAFGGRRPQSHPELRPFPFLAWNDRLGVLSSAGNLVRRAGVKTCTDAEGAIKMGADLVAVGRAVVVDPEWLSKVRSKSEASILAGLPKAELEIAKALSIPPRMVEYLLSRPGWIPRL
jgi:hypothetical protein